uniref:Terminase small subunit n=1 Tax=Myoviridae sp. ct2cn10 TaxID=2825022 RepID=A0A8S5P9S2_9CAUD|nr:terminase small subunit [uncultured Lachnoclostridium sp.]DAE03935.1 MAG TPA: Terminase small subunit [Myoviridae sp. ct2cn10]
MAKLTAKQEAFVKEYLIDLNATQAAIRAGYSVNRASELGYQLLQKTTVSKAIARAMEDRSKRTGITADMVINELAQIAFANGTDFAKVVEKPMIVNNSYVMDPDTGQLKTYTAVELIPTDKLPEDKRKAVAGIKEGKYGIEVASCDKVKALELLGRHLGMFKDKVEITGLNEEKSKLDGIITQLRGGK